MAKALMIQGTGSGVGKSVIVAGLCRIFRDMGIRVAPFKAQNMALNSFITKEGGEIGRAQALQAEAAGIEPCNDMNPILLKATGEAGSQVILNGKVYRNMNAIDYYAFKDKAWRVVTSAYERLSQKHEVIVIEGAGSPAEINLMDDEIVNMRVARYADAPVILVGDIDKGGVFASLYGTIELLKDSRFRIQDSKPNKCIKIDADYIKAFIINKFRGDIDILRPGLRMLEDKTGRPVIGVIKYLGDLGVHEEDAIPLERFRGSRVQGFKDSKIKIVVLRLRYISNFTDFDPFLYEPDVELLYSSNPSDIENADIVIVPGTKNTVKDLLFLKERRLDGSIKKAYEKGIHIIGICGGYQILGQRIYDPMQVETTVKEIEGIGLLNIETLFDTTKITSQVEAELNTSAFFSHSTVRPSLLKGYEIHMGRSDGDISLFKISRITDYASRITGLLDGSMNGHCWGTYIHGIFDNDEFRRGLLNSLRKRKGLNPLNGIVRYHEQREMAIERWADTIRKSVDICFILRLLGMERCMKDYIQNL